MKNQPTSVKREELPRASKGLEIVNDTLIGIGTCTDTEIVIPDGITRIEEGAFDSFYNKHKITSIIIPDSVKSIGRMAFSECYYLKHCKIPSGVTRIEDDTFGFCHKLVEVEIPDSVTSIGDYAFNECVALTHIKMPDNVTHIGECAFFCCKELTELSIPHSVIEIGKWAFANCTSLHTLTFEGTREQWKAIPKGDKWNLNCDFTSIHCADGVIEGVEYPPKETIIYINTLNS